MRIIDADLMQKAIAGTKAQLTHYPDIAVCEFAAQMLDAMPTVDAVPVVHGRWTVVSPANANNNVECECSLCHCGEIHAATLAVPYCWHCGARMEGENDKP